MENEVLQSNDIFYKEQLSTDNHLNIIVNADDLGICLERDEAIFELYSKGIVTSASILVNGKNFENSVIKAKNMNMPLGMHLNLTEGTPINQKEINKNSLVCYEGATHSYVMHGKFGLRQKLNEGKINVNDIKYEIISQVKKFKFI
jgi:predicted glycoside hydrolase/deacetylase ChbG (UPF0249 family)